MNICIVTVYNSKNCGSFLQAYALKKFFEENGDTVFFFRRSLKDSAYSREIFVKKIIKALIKLKIQDFTREIKFYHNYSIVKRDNFKEIDMQNFLDKKIEYVVLGSDTIWDLSNEYFYKHRKIFWGDIFSLPCISYAPSLANTTKEQIKNSDVISFLKKIKAISVRDLYSKKLLQEISDYEISVVCDPTLLIDRKEFDKLYPKKIKEKYILLYYFGEMPKELVQNVILFSKRNNLEIISFGEQRKWCDTNLIYHPYEFVGYFRHAEYIVTNTFHGTIFSVIYNKKFIVNTCNKKKVIEFLEECLLQNRQISSENYNIDVIKEEIEYKVVNQKLSEIREKSRSFLRNNIYS